MVLTDAQFKISACLCYSFLFVSNAGKRDLALRLFKKINPDDSFKGDRANSEIFTNEKRLDRI